MFEPRDYQLQGIEAVRQCIRDGNRKILLVSPTGSGKTVIASHIIQNSDARGYHSLFVAHRREIIFQTSHKLKAVGVDHGLILSGHKQSFMAMTHVASIQTLVRRNAPRADLLIFDEAHHVSAGTYQRILNQYPEAVILGLTATPCRRDGKGLGATFEKLVQVASIEDLIAQGFLVPVTPYAPSRPDLTGVRKTAGDYNEGDLEKAVDKPKLIGDIVDHWHRLAGSRKTILFAATIGHSQHMVEAFRASGVKVQHIDGEMDHGLRDRILEEYREGDLQVICNVGVLTEGFDAPETGCIVLARPTKSFGLFVQMLGRGMRPAQGKQDCILLDHAGAIYEHGLPNRIDWQLEPGELAYKPRKYEKKEDAPWVCKSCSHINPTHRVKFCEACGLRPINGIQAPAVGEGLLQKVEPKFAKLKDRNDLKRVWMDCFWSAVHKDLKLGAAAHMYRSRTGRWPRQFDFMPTDSTMWQMKASVYYERFCKGAM